MSILYQNLDLTQSKICYGITRHQFYMNETLLSSRPILYLRRKKSKHCNKLEHFSQCAPNEILLIHQILNSNEPKIFYSDARHKFYRKSPSLALGLFFFQKNYKDGNKLEKCSIKDDS